MDVEDRHYAQKHKIRIKDTDVETWEPDSVFGLGDDDPLDILIAKEELEEEQEKQ